MCKSRHLKTLPVFELLFHCGRIVDIIIYLLQAHILVGSLHIQDIQLKTVNILRRTNLMILYSYNTISKDTVLQHQLTPTTLNIENIKQEETMNMEYGLEFCCTTTLLSLNRFLTFRKNS